MYDVVVTYWHLQCFFVELCSFAALKTSTIFCRATYHALGTNLTLYGCGESVPPSWGEVVR